MVFNGHFQSGANDCLIALGLPEVDVERAVQVFQPAGTLDHTSSG
jgi:hypothetical protein